MIVAQITDLHLVDPGETLSGLVDTNALALAAVEHLRAFEPRPDVVLVTGDLADEARPVQYALLRDTLDGLGIPYWVIPGNHDRRAPLLEAFGGHAAVSPGGFVQYTVEDHPARLVALDTLVEGHEEGLLCEQRLAWLDETLGADPDRPTLLFMHHPPFETGVWWMDTAGLSGAEALRRLVARHPQVQRIVCGHIHRPIQTNWGGTLVSVAPSTAHQVHLDLVPESRPHVIFEPPACLLHVFDGAGFVTHTSYVGLPEEPLDLTAFMGEWEVVKAAMRARKAVLR